MNNITLKKNLAVVDTVSFMLLDVLLMVKRNFFSFFFFHLTRSSNHCSVKLGKSFAVKVTSLVKLNRSDARIYGDAMLKELRMIKRLQSKSSHIIHMYTFDFNAKLGLGYIVMERGMHNLEKQLYFRPVQSIQMKFFWKQLADMAITLYNNGIVS